MDFDYITIKIKVTCWRQVRKWEPFMFINSVHIIRMSLTLFTKFNNSFIYLVLELPYHAMLVCLLYCIQMIAFIESSFFSSSNTNIDTSRHVSDALACCASCLYRCTSSFISLSFTLAASCAYYSIIFDSLSTAATNI